MSSNADVTSAPVDSSGAAARTIFGYRLPAWNLSLSSLQTFIGLATGVLSIGGAFLAIPSVFFRRRGRRRAMAWAASTLVRRWLVARRPAGNPVTTVSRRGQVSRRNPVVAATGGVIPVPIPILIPVAIPIAVPTAGVAAILVVPTVVALVAVPAAFLVILAVLICIIPLVVATLLMAVAPIRGDGRWGRQ